MWPTQYIYLASGFIIILCHCHHCLCTVILATALMGATSCVACILAYLPHKCTLSNLACGIFMAFKGHIYAGIYFVVV